MYFLVATCNYICTFILPIGFQVLHYSLKKWYEQMRTAPSLSDNIIKLSYSDCPCVGYLSVFHDSLLQYSEGCVKLKTTTLKTLRDIQDLFESASEKCRSILIEGQTGIGKTTICKEICYQWAKNSLLTTDKLVLLLLLQDPNVQKIASECQLVNYFSVSAITKDTLMKYLEDGCGAGITFILDGYNKLSVQQQKNSFFKDLIEGKMLVEARVIVTSEPLTTKCFHNCVDLRIELFELAKYNKQEFIAMSLKNHPSRSKKLWKHLLHYPKIELLTRTPINTTIMISLCLNSHCPLPTTATEMYEQFILFAVGHKTNCMANKIGDFPPSVLYILKQINYFAYETLIDEKETFHKTDLQDVCGEDLTCYGLIQCTNYYSSQSQNQVAVFSFLHHGLQEYLAARYVADLPNAEIIALMKSSFTPGVLNKQLCSMWTMAFDIIKCRAPPPHSKACALFSSLQIEKAYWDLSSIKILNLFQILHGIEKFDDIVSQKFSGSSKIDFSYHELLPYQIISLGLLLLSDVLKNISELNLSGCHIADYGLYLLQKYFSIADMQLNELDLCNNNLTAASATFLSNICDCTKPCSLELNYNSLGDTGVLDICHTVVRNKIAKLELVKNDITVEGTKAVAFLLSSTSLEELDISYNNIGDIGAERLSEKLTRSVTLKSLAMKYCNIGEEGAYKLAHALTTNSSLEILWMNGNATGHCGATEFAVALCTNNTLKELSLTGDTTIDYTAASEILASFYENTTLTDLDLPAEFSDKESLTTELEYINIDRSRGNYEPLHVSFW